MLRSPVRLERDTNGTIRVEFPDVPEAHTFGENRNEALRQAIDALETALMFYIADRREIPKPSPVKDGTPSVTVPAPMEAQVESYAVMRTRGEHR